MVAEIPVWLTPLPMTLAVTLLQARADPTVEDEQGRRASSVVMGAVLGQGLDNALVRQARDRLVDLMQVGGAARWLARLHYSRASLLSTTALLCRRGEACAEHALSHSVRVGGRPQRAG